METTLPESSKKKIILILSILAVCFLCALVGASGVFLYKYTRPTPAADISFPAWEMGESSAKVIVEVFSDFQCPYCRLFATTALPRLREEYIHTGKIRFIFRNDPIVDSYVAYGKESHQAALAALCAGEQQKFWEYHDILFQNQSGQNQGNFSDARLESFAAQVDLDVAQFHQCQTVQTYFNILNADILRANALRLTGVPSFLVNGIILEMNSSDFQFLFDAVDREVLTIGA